MQRSTLLTGLLALAAATSLSVGLVRISDAATGAVIYRANPQVFEDSGIAAPGSQVPVKLVLPSKAGVLVNAGDVLSAPSVATGPDAGFLLVARGGELRTCVDATCSTGGTFASSVRAANGGFVQARLAGPTTVGGVNRMTVESGSYTGTFEVSATSDAGLDPVADVVNAEPGSLQVSTASTLKGFASTILSVTGGEYRLNGGAWTTTSSTAKAGDRVELRVTAGPVGAVSTATLSVAGGSQVSFSATTRAQDTLPDPFTIAALPSVEPGVAVVSSAVMPTGYDGTVSVSVAGGQVSVANGAFASSASVSAGQSLVVRLTSSPTFGATATASVTVGTGPAVPFSATTRAQDTTPDAFVVADALKAEPSTAVTSAAVTPTGFDGSVPISASGGTVSVAGGAYATSGTIALGQSFTVRATSSASYAADVTATVTVGSGSATPFKVRTRADVLLADQALSTTVGSAFSFDFKTLTTTQGVAASALTYASSDKPSWMTVSAAGVASGTPTAAATAGFTLTATHADGSAQRVYSITVADERIAATKIVGGYGHTCALTTGGTVKCWGGNSLGQLGNGTTTDSLTAVSPTGLPAGVTDIASSNSSVCALAAGGLWCWGYNGQGQLGLGDTTNRTVPTSVPGMTTGVRSVAMSAFSSSTCAALTTNKGKCWGLNTSGQLGNGDRTNRTSPTDLSGSPSDVSEFAVANSTVCYVTTSAGVRCAGGNGSGQMGTGSIDGNYHVSFDPSLLTSGVTKLSAGSGSFCAVHSGVAKCWGSNTNGQLGNGSTTDTGTPVSTGISGATGVAALANSACAVTSAKTVSCWGYNGLGQLGDGTTTNRTAPVAVTGLTGATALGSGYYHVCAVVGSNAAKCWGNGASGQLGTKAQANSSTPVDMNP